MYFGVDDSGSVGIRCIGNGGTLLQAIPSLCGALRGVRFRIALSVRRIVLLVRVGWSDNFPQKRDDGPHLGEREDVAVTEALCTGFFVDEWTGRG